MASVRWILVSVVTHGALMKVNCKRLRNKRSRGPGPEQGTRRLQERGSNPQTRNCSRWTGGREGCETAARQQETMEREESMSVKSQREQRKDKFVLTKAGNQSNLCS